MAACEKHKVVHKTPTQGESTSAAQSFAQIPVEEAASASDIYAFTGHKWACGPEGLGGVALSERVLNEYNPKIIGWRTLKDENKIIFDSSYKFHNDSRRFEIATSCIPLMSGLRKSLELMDQTIPLQARKKTIMKISKELWEKLTESNLTKTILDSPPPSGLVSFKLNKR